MKNFIIRTITAVFFVAAIVTCFLRPEAMILLFALVTGLTIWEFTGLVNEAEAITVNRMICTVAGVYFFFAMAGYNSGLTPATVFIPYLVSIIYLLVAELYLKQENPINDWAYTMMSQLYIALPFSLLNVLAFRSTGYDIRYTYLVPLSVFVFLWINDTGAYLCGSLLGKHKLFPRISPGRHPRDGRGRPGMVSDGDLRCQRHPPQRPGVGRTGPDRRHLRHLGRPD